MLSKIKKYRHGFIIAIYFVAYLILFGYLEQRPVRAYHVVHTVFDDMIPFCEIFIIPYLLWFPYVVMTVVYFLFRNKNKKEYFQLIFNLMMGMTVFLLFPTSIRTFSISALRYSPEATSLHDWWPSSIGQILPPTSCQVSMYLIPWLFILPFITARH